MILDNIQILIEKEKEVPEELIAQFYSTIPHKSESVKKITTPQALEEKFLLIDLIERILEEEHIVEKEDDIIENENLVTL